MSEERGVKVICLQAGAFYESPCAIVNYVYLALLVSALSLIQCLIGGTRLLYSFPSYCLLGVCGVLTLFSVFRRPKERPDSWCLLASVGVFAYILARAKFSPIDYLARQDFFMVLGCLLVYFLTTFFLTTTRDRLIVIASLFVMVVLHVYVGSIQFMKNSQYMLFGFVRTDDSFRASGLYISGNHMSGFLEALAVIGLSLVWWGRWPIWAKVLVGYLSLGCYAGVAMSASRGGMLSSAFSLLVLSILGMVTTFKIGGKQSVVTLIAWGLIAAIGVGGACLIGARSQLITTRLHQQHTADVRIYNWQATLDQFRLARLVGTGAGTHLYYGRLFRRPQIQTDPVHSHGDYLELLAEYGIIGAVGMGLFLMAHLRSGFRAYNFLGRRLRNSYVPRSNTLALNIGVLSAVFALLAHSVVDFNMHIPANALVFAFFFGILANPGIASEKEKGRFELVLSGLRYALPLLGIVVWGMVVPKYPGEYFTEKSRVALRDKHFQEAISFGKRAVGEKIDETCWLDRLNRYFGGEKKNPFVYFYMGEAQRGIAMPMFNKTLRRTYLAPAADFYNQGLKIFPQDENTLVRLGQCYDGMEQFDQAERAYKKAIQSDPNLGVLYDYYAAHLKQEGKKVDIEKILARARVLGKQNITETGGSELMMK